MTGRLSLLIPKVLVAALALSVLLASGAGEAAKKKSTQSSASKKSKKSTKKPAGNEAADAPPEKELDASKYQGPMMPVFQGPPAPPVLRAAGVCMQYEPGVFIVLAEVGGSGRVFRLDANTALEVKPQRGGRLRILYVDGVDGPLARKVLQGPVEVNPTATPAPQPTDSPR